MSQSVKGILKTAGEEVRVSDKFRKRDFVVIVEPASQYPQPIQFQLAQDKCDLIDVYTEGEELIVHYNLRGREWTKDGKTAFFNTLSAWKLEKVANQNSQPTQHNTPSISANTNFNDDLPF